MFIELKKLNGGNLYHLMEQGMFASFGLGRTLFVNRTGNFANCDVNFVSDY